jgi:hypothetical protein
MTADGGTAAQPGLGRFVPWGLSLLSASYVLTATGQHGLGVGSDGAIYLSAARSLLEGTGFTSFEGTPYVHWPPLYPLALALFGWAGGIDPARAAPYVNAAALFGAVLLAARWLPRHVTHHAVLLGSSAVLVLSVPLANVSLWMLSETLFILWTVCFLVLAGRMLKDRGSGWLVLAACAAACAFLTRYMGLAVVLTGVALLSSQPLPLWDRLRRILLFGTLGTLPVLAWVVRTYRLTETLTGSRVASPEGLGANLLDALEALSLFFFPDEVAAGLRMLVAGLLTVLVLSLGVRALRRVPGDYGLVVPGACVLVYLGVLLAVRTTFASVEVNVRLMAPLFIPLVMVAAGVIDRSWTGWPRVLRRLAGALLCLWLCYPLYVVSKRWAAASRGEVGEFSRPAWEQSPLIARLRDEVPSMQLFSNAPAALYLLAGRQAVLGPLYYQHDPAASRQELERFRERLAAGGRRAYVWFDAAAPSGDYPARPYSVDALQPIVELMPLLQAEDGTVYEMGRVRDDP